MSDVVPVFSQAVPKIRKITIDQPWRWLSAGWSDLRAAPSVGLGYAAIFVCLGLLLALLIWSFQSFAVVLPLTGGFLLVAPVLAVGLYETSRRLEAGEPVSMGLALTAWQRNLGQVALMGLVLLLLFIAWMRIAFLIFMFFFSYEPPRPESFLADIFFSDMSASFLAVGTIVGALLALLAFAISAISVPMLLDRDVNVVLAIATSFEAVRQNFLPMLVWASLIVLFTFAGLACFYLGLVVTLPLIGHASWHAYRDLVAPES